MTPAPSSTTLTASGSPSAEALGLIALQEARQVMRSGAIAPQAFSDLGRSQTTLLAALPARYTEVLHDLLDRLESSALFADESCSFSQGDLIDHLQGWLEQAARQLKKWQMPPA